MMKRIRLKPHNDLYRDPRDNISERGWNSGKRKDETNETENLKGLRNKELITWMSKNKNYVMHGDT